MSNNSPLPFGCLVGLLKKSISDAVVDPDTRNRVTSDILTNAFKQVDAHFRDDNSGPSAFKLLLGKLATAWQIRDLRAGVDCLRSFGVADGVLLWNISASSEHW